MTSNQSALGRIVLITGPEEFLGEQVVSTIRGQVKQADPESDFVETAANLLDRAGLEECTSPSLFAATRCVVVRNLEQLPEASWESLLEYAAAPLPDIALVLVHSGGNKGTGLLNKLRKCPAVVEQKSAPIKAYQLPEFVISQARVNKARMGEAAAGFLVQSLGSDLRSLAAAVGQLASDFPGEELTLERVQQYYGGRAEAKSFAVADHVVNGDVARALEETRWILDRGAEHVLITAACARALRQVALCKATAGRLRGADLAREIQVPTWRLKSLLAQARGWEDAGLSTAIQAVA
ncbi:MAG TPA: DNA polymerase III subunit delta, partial [Marmoricola sp.]|nr:DNA polymerase III subunit delta [Marmoricola sp.]